MIEVLTVLSARRHRFGIDGQGVTTLVALKGCNLHCKYCCNAQLLKSEGKDISVDVLWKSLLIDYCYFLATGGGVTFGGGEPLLQADGLRSFMLKKPEGVACNIETSLNVPLKALEKVVDLTDFFLIDLKSVDSQIYKSYTGCNNENVLRNLKYLAERGLQNRCLVRIPDIPDFSGEADILFSLDYVKALGFSVERFPYIKDVAGYRVTHKLAGVNLEL